jgi:hypothetical protein
LQDFQIDHTITCQTKNKILLAVLSTLTSQKLQNDLKGRSETQTPKLTNNITLNDIFIIFLNSKKYYILKEKIQNILDQLRLDNDTTFL